MPAVSCCAARESIGERRPLLALQAMLMTTLPRTRPVPARRSGRRLRRSRPWTIAFMFLFSGPYACRDRAREATSHATRDSLKRSVQG